MPESEQAIWAESMARMAALKKAAEEAVAAEQVEESTPSLTDVLATWAEEQVASEPVAEQVEQIEQAAPVEYTDYVDQAGGSLDAVIGVPMTGSATESVAKPVAEVKKAERPARKSRKGREEVAAQAEQLIEQAKQAVTEGTAEQIG
jgi:hypothetical protein